MKVKAAEGRSSRWGVTMGVFSVIAIKSNHFCAIFGYFLFIFDALVHMTVSGSFLEKLGKTALGPSVPNFSII